MQHGESGAAIPRHLSKQYGKTVVNGHNSKRRATEWTNPLSGKRADRTGTFKIETKEKKRKR